MPQIRRPQYDGDGDEVGLSGSLQLIDGQLIDDLSAAPAQTRAPTPRPAEAYFRDLFDCIPVAIYSCDVSGVIGDFNRRAAELWGRTPALGDTDERFCGSYKMFRPDGVFMPHDPCPMAEVLSGAIPNFEDGEVHIERPDGSRIIVLMTIRPLKNQRGEITGAINCFYDITERKEAERTRATLAAIVDSSDDAIISKTLDGIITSWNRSAERMFGYTAAEAVGRHITLIVPDELRAQEEEVLARLRRGEIIDHFETERQAQGGDRITLSLTISPIRDSSGRIIGASKVARNITERKRVERERKTLLSNERAARREAQAANRAKDMFLATLSHELRTPLNAIVGWAQLLAAGGNTPGGNTPEELREGIEAIQRSAQAQARLIGDLLDVSRIISGKLRLEMADCDLAGIIHAAMDVVRPAATAKGIELTGLTPTASTAPLSVAVHCDPDRIQQVIWNLLTNAVKFTPAAGKISVALSHQPNMARIDITDTGAGIAPDLLPHVFERYRQAESGGKRGRDQTSGGQGGLGLGLNIVRHITEAHGGTASVASAGEGTGSTFTLTLPIRAGA